MDSDTIIVLGGGVGGLVAANELRQRLPEEIRIVLVEENARHAFAASFLWQMVGDRKPEKIPGLAESAHTFYTLDGAVRLGDELQSLTEGKVAVVVSAKPYKCPGAPYEGAMLIADFLEKRGLKDKTEVHLFSFEPMPMPVAGPELGSAVVEMLETKGVIFHPLHQLTDVKPEVRLMLPKAGVFAHGQAKVVAKRIAAEIKGHEPTELFCGDGYCMLEAGETLAGFAYGDFFAQPNPQVKLRDMGKTWHLGKVLFEKWWLAPFGFRRTFLGLTLKLGGRALGIPVDL